MVAPEPAGEVGRAEYGRAFFEVVGRDPLAPPGRMPPSRARAVRPVAAAAVRADVEPGLPLAALVYWRITRGGCGGHRTERRNRPPLSCVLWTVHTMTPMTTTNHGSKVGGDQGPLPRGIAKLIRADIKAAVRPAFSQACFRVTCRLLRAAARSLTSRSRRSRHRCTTWSACCSCEPARFERMSRYLPPDDEGDQRRSSIHGAYNYDGSDIQTDYFHVRVLRQRPGCVAVRRCRRYEELRRRSRLTRTRPAWMLVLPPRWPTTAFPSRTSAPSEAVRAARCIRAGLCMDAPMGRKQERHAGYSTPQDARTNKEF